MKKTNTNYHPKKISVLMGVYNCESTVVEAIRSIQSQTNNNWELIVCDDGSTDETLKKVEKAASLDPRIIVLKNDNNKGLNITLNKCLMAASGDYIARMDGDDISRADRFEKQALYLEKHPDVQIVSSWMTMFDENGEWGIQKIPENPTKEQIVIKTVIHHAPVMMRAECLREVNGYTEDVRKLRVEDVDLWIKLYEKGYKCYNIQEPLYAMRNDINALNRRKFKYRINSTRTRLEGCKKLHLGLECYLYSFRPIVYGLVPARTRNWLKRARIKKNEN